MNANPYKIALLVISILLAIAGAIFAIAGAVEYNSENANTYLGGGDPLAGAVQYAFANWLLSGAVFAFFFWLVVSGVTWAIFETRVIIPPAFAPVRAPESDS